MVLCEITQPPFVLSVLYILTVLLAMGWLAESFTVPFTITVLANKLPCKKKQQRIKAKRRVVFI